MPPKPRTPIVGPLGERQSVKESLRAQGIDYQIKPIQLYRPEGKKEVRLVYRAFHKNGSGDANLKPGFSTRHQKSFSIPKLTMAGAWKAAQEAFNYCERYQDLPDYIDLPPTALKIKEKPGKGDVRAPGQGRKIPSRSTISDSQLHDLQAAQLARYTQPQQQQLLAQQQHNAHQQPKIQTVVPIDYSQLPMPNIGTQPLMAPPPQGYHMTATGPRPGIDVLPSTEFFAQSQPNMFQPGLSLSLSDGNGPTQKVLSLMNQRISTNLEDVVEHQLHSEIQANKPEGEERAGKLMDVLSECREQSVWAAPPPYTFNLMNWNASSMNFHRNPVPTSAEQGGSSTGGVSLTGYNSHLVPAAEAPLSHGDSTAATTPMTAHESHDSPSSAFSSPAQGREASPAALPGLPSGVIAASGAPGSAASPYIANTSFPGTGGAGELPGQLAWASVPIPQLHLLQNGVSSVHPSSQAAPHAQDPSAVGELIG